MSYNCCSGSISSSSLGGCLRYPSSFCGSSYPSNLVSSSGLCSPSTCQPTSSLYSGCQEICSKPIRYQPSCVVSSPCQNSCYRPRPSTFCNPCQTMYTGSLSCGTSSSYSTGCGSGSSYSLGCGSIRPQVCGVSRFPSLSSGSGFCCPSGLTSRPCQSSCYKPSYGSGFC
ncbi:keratin-associated protein 13-2-like [Erinaceus europaeus]|uniref:Keratin-associated protein n=1 Tax=Erinaceus europaeus TaxID=9365 RepID=A0A1S3A369_ERIEU|nr:keratin-associated protein 13-2-like [Erinaceus europaeus]